MEAVYAISKATVLFSVLVQLVMLALQAAALRRHKQQPFFILCASTVLITIYTVVVNLPYFTYVQPAVALTILKVVTPIGMAGAVMGVWGTASLFKLYRRLSELVRRNDTISA